MCERITIASTSHVIISFMAINNFPNDICIGKAQYNKEKTVYESNIVASMTRDEAEDLYRDLKLRFNF